MQLLQRLCEKGLLTEADAARATEAQRANPDRPLHELIIEKGFAKEYPVLETLAELFGLELVDLTQRHVDPETLAIMPTKLVHRKNLMPIERQNGTLIVATGDPFDVYSLDELSTVTGLHVQPVLGSPRELA